MGNYGRDGVGIICGDGDGAANSVSGVVSITNTGTNYGARFVNSPSSRSIMAVPKARSLQTPEQSRANCLRQAARIWR